MAHTYDPNLSSDRDRLRQQLGDTGDLKDDAGASVWLLPDETYTATLAGRTFNEALAVLAEQLAATFGQRPTEVDDEGKVRIKWSDRAAFWWKVADRARAKPPASTETGSSFASHHGGGYNVSGFR